MPLQSLSNDAKSKDPDCRTCNRRRIRCDRSLPTCKKCALKELPCPGYGLRIQFGQGVASRGKLMGKALPIIEPAPSSTTEADLEARSLTPGEHSDPSDGFDDQDSSTVSHSLRAAFYSSPEDTLAHNRSTLGRDLSTSYNLPPYLQGRPVTELVHYYDNHVASLMPWVDGPENPWRALMLPLAFRSPSHTLLLAMLAFSAEHYSSRPDFDWPENDGFNTNTYRDRSLQMLAQDLQAEIDEDASPARQLQASGILATILVLCNLEMIRCSTTTWHVHWKAARTITRRWTAPHLASTILDDTCRFLLKEAFVYDVFGSSTTFGDVDQIPSSVLTDADAGIFTHWLQVVQDVTCAERRRNGNPPSDEPLPPNVANMNVLQQRFDHARIQCREFSKSIIFGTTESTAGFSFLIDIFHYAGLAYSFSTLFNLQDPTVQKAVQHNVMAVIAKTTHLQHDEAYQHDLVWPLFVVGTQSRDNHAWQEFADSTLRAMMQSTGFSNCEPALTFLRRFWATDPSVVSDWMQFARKESKHGHHFLVI